MGRQNILKLTCDLCHHPGADFPNEAEAKIANWVEVNYENYYLERYFQSAWVCPKCAGKIVAGSTGLSDDKTPRERELEDLLSSARAIAQRRGQGTAWERFDNRLAAAGISDVTAKTFPILPSDPP